MGKSPFGAFFYNLQHTPWLQEGPEMSRDREGGIKRVGGNTTLPET